MEAESTRSKWAKMWPCLFAVFVDVLGFALTLPVFTIIFTGDYFFASNIPEATRLAYLSVGLALYPMFMFFGSSFMGDLSDIIGRKKVLLICMGGFTLGFCLMGWGSFLKSITLLFIGRGMTGLMAASLATTLAAISDMSSASNKAGHMSLVVFMQCVGLVLAPFIGGVLSDSTIVNFFSPALPFYVSALLSTIAFLWIATAYGDSNRVQSNKKLHLLRLIQVFVEVAKHGRIRLLTLIFFLQQMGMALFMQLILIYLQRKFGYTGFMMGMYNVFFGFVTCIGVVFVPILARRMRVEWVACFSAGLMGLAQCLMIFSEPSHYYVWMIGGLVSLFGIITWTTILTAFSNAAAGHEQGWALGITGSVVSLSFLVTGLAPNLVPLVGTSRLIVLGGFGVLISFICFIYYCKRKMPTLTD